MLLTPMTMYNTTHNSNRESLEHLLKYLQNVRTKYLVMGLLGINQVFEFRK